MTRPNLATTGTRLAADRAPSTCYGAASYPSVQSPIKRHRENGSRVGSQHEGAPGRHPNRHTPRHLESPVTMPPAAAQPRRIWTALPNLRSEQRTDSAPRRLLWLTAIVEYYQRPKCSRSPECNNTTLGQRLKRAMKTTRVTVCCLKCLGCRHTRMSTKRLPGGRRHTQCSPRCRHSARVGQLLDALVDGAALTDRTLHADRGTEAGDGVDEMVGEGRTSQSRQGVGRCRSSWPTVWTTWCSAANACSALANSSTLAAFGFTGRLIGRIVGVSVRAGRVVQGAVGSLDRRQSGKACR